MTAMSIRLPASLHRNARAYAEQEGVSVNQLKRRKTWWGQVSHFTDPAGQLKGET